MSREHSIGDFGVGCMGWLASGALIDAQKHMKLGFFSETCVSRVWNELQYVTVFGPGF